MIADPSEALRDTYDAACFYALESCAPLHLAYLSIAEDKRRVSLVSSAARRDRRPHFGSRVRLLLFWLTSKADESRSQVACEALFSSMSSACALAYERASLRPGQPTSKRSLAHAASKASRRHIGISTQPT